MEAESSVTARLGQMKRILVNETLLFGATVVTKSAFDKKHLLTYLYHGVEIAVTQIDVGMSIHPSSWC
jgi:hypothetical protein